MSAPVAQGAQVPWSRYKFGRIRELCLRSCLGVSDAAHASPDTSLPPATAQEKAVVGGFCVEALVELQECRELYWPLSEETATAEESAVTAGTYPAVLLPADYGAIAKNGLHVAGNPVGVMTTEQYLSARVPDSLGGGVNLTLVSGQPPTTAYVARIAPALQALLVGVNDPSAEWRMALWLYPLQTAAWTLECAYRATARNYTNDTDAVRLPSRMLRLVTMFVSARVAEFNGDVSGSASRWALYEKALNTIEGIPPALEQQQTMVLVPPLDA